MINILFKSTGIWLLIVVMAIFNGLFREKILVSLIGTDLALPLSGLLLSILVFLVSFTLITFLDFSTASVLFVIGGFWVLLTLSFEFLFGHFVVGKSWQEIMQVFNILEGDFFLLVLIVTALSPWMAAKARGIL